MTDRARTMAAHLAAEIPSQSDRYWVLCRMFDRLVVPCYTSEPVTIAVRPDLREGFNGHVAWEPTQSAWAITVRDDDNLMTRFHELAHISRGHLVKDDAPTASRASGTLNETTAIQAIEQNAAQHEQVWRRMEEDARLWAATELLAWLEATPPPKPLAEVKAPTPAPAPAPVPTNTPPAHCPVALREAVIEQDDLTDLLTRALVRVQDQSPGGLTTARIRQVVAATVRGLC